MQLASDLKDKVQEAKQGLKFETDKVVEAIKIEAHLSKRYYRTFLFVTGSLFLLNGILLYIGTLCGYEVNFFCVDLARFYGFREGKWCVLF
jgi:hypothetical protein